MHVPPGIKTFNFHSFDKNLEYFSALMKRYSSRIALVLSGHIHGYAAVEEDGVKYIISGGAGAPLTSSREGIIGKYNYVLVDVAHGNVSHSVKFMDK